METVLGKISRVKFGHVGYQDCMLGLELTFAWPGAGIGCGALPGVFWDPYKLEHHKNARWTEEDRDKCFIKHMRYISRLLHEAKVDDVYKLKDIPVEIKIENNTFKDFRILKEVL